MDFLLGYKPVIPTFINSFTTHYISVTLVNNNNNNNNNNPINHFLNYYIT